MAWRGRAAVGWFVGFAALPLLCGATWAGAAEPGPSGGLPGDHIAHQNERAFLAGNQAAMTRMMTGMSPRPTGDIDRDFVDMMTPHHQGAIDMAVLVLRYGHNEQVRRLAQEIIVDQQQEIAAMRQAVGEPIPASAPAPTNPPRNRKPMPGMVMR